MNREDIITYISEPGRLDQSTLTNVSELINSYPYFQTAHLLKVKNLHNINSLEFNDALKYSSAFIGDRAVLYHLIHDEVLGEPAPGEVAENEDERQVAVIEMTPDPEREEVDKEDMPVIDADEPTGAKDQDDSRVTDEPDMAGQPVMEAKTEPGAIIHTFTGWFDHLPDSYPDTVDPDRSETELIDTFIRNRPQIERSREEPTEQKDMSEEYVQLSDQFMTETLAKIYVAQGKVAKAIYVYEKLSLKYPEKSSYFATQIRKISHNIDE